MIQPRNRLRASRALLQALNLRSNERRPVALLWTYSFFLGLGAAYFYSAAIPKFLATFPIDYLPAAFAGAALLELTISFGSRRLEKLLSQSRLHALLLWIVVIVTVIFRLALLQGTVGAAASIWAAFGLYIWYRVIVFISQNEFWDISSHIFDVRQSKRLFSLIDSGSFLAKILGFFSVPLLLTIIHVPDLLVLSALSTAVCFFIMRGIMRSIPHLTYNQMAHGAPRDHSATQHPQKRQHGTISVLWRHKYIASVASVAFLSFIAMTCIDYGFLREIGQKYGGATHLAYFLSIFLGAAQVLSLILKVGIVGRLFNRFGLARVSEALPLALLVTTAIGLALSFKAKSGAVMIATFIASKLFVEIWSDAVQSPALAVALQPLHHHERHEGQRAIEIMEPIALGVAALLLYVLSVSIGFTLRGISVVILGVFVAWTVAILWFDREYHATVLRALKHRRLDPEELTWDEATREMITQKLRSEHVGEAEYSLRLIPKSENSFFLAQLPPLLHNSSESLQIAAVQRIEDFDFPHDERTRVAEILNGLLKDNSITPNLLGHALHAYSSVVSEFDPDAVRHWLDADSIQVRKWLLAGLIQYQGIDGILTAGERLQKMINSSDPRERVAAAEIVGQVGVKQFYRPILKLIGDDSADVRLAAVHASTQVAHPRLIEPILDLYLQPVSSQRLLSAVESALHAFGAAALSHISKRIEDGLFDSSRLLRVTKLFGLWAAEEDRSASSSSAKMLLSFLTWPVTHHRILGSLRLASLRALVDSAVSMGEETIIQKLIQEELDRAKTLLDIALGLEHAKPLEKDGRAARIDLLEHATRSAMLLRGAVSYEIVQTAQRMLLLLALSYDRQIILRIRDSFAAGDELHWANAFETLDHLLPSAQSKQIITLMEASLLLAGRKRDGVLLRDIVQSSIPEANGSIHTLLTPLLNDKERFYDPWTVATGIYFVGMYLWPAFSQNVMEAANRPDLAGKIAQMILQHHGGEFVHLSEGLESGADISPKTSTTLTPSNFNNNSIEDKPMPVLFERVILLKTVDLFRETPDPVLSHVAKALEEIHAPRGTKIIEKGEMGTCLYIIVEGKVRVQDGDHVLAELGSRQVVGELALLDPEPRSASVIAIEETTLLKLDWEAFYDLMVDNIEIARGAIATLCRRIRKQNEQLSHLQTEQVLQESVV